MIWNKFHYIEKATKSLNTNITNHRKCKLEKWVGPKEKNDVECALAINQF